MNFDNLNIYIDISLTFILILLFLLKKHQNLDIYRIFKTL